MAVTFKYDVKVAPEFLDVARQIPLVGMRALNRVGASAMSRASKNIRDIYNVKKSDLDPSLKASERATKDRFSFTIRAGGRPMPLMAFGARQKSPGVSAMVKIGTHKVYPHTFIAEMESGHKGVFLRVGSPRVPLRGRYKGMTVTRGRNKGQPLKRQPIKEQFRLAASQMFASSKNLQDLGAFISDKLPREILAQLKYFTRPGSR